MPSEGVNSNERERVVEWLTGIVAVLHASLSGVERGFKSDSTINGRPSGHHSDVISYIDIRHETVEKNAATARKRTHQIT